MTYTLHIKRQETAQSKPYWQDLTYTTKGRDSVATALASFEHTDTPIGWQRSCLVRKCGACAMRINGIPRLACSTFLEDLKTKTITLEPLRKFPVVHDLIVDRSVIHTILKKLQTWHETTEPSSPWTLALRRESSRCLECGCCLEVCPNFTGEADFAGALGAVNTYRIVESEPAGPHRKAVTEQYKNLYYNICNQSLACHDICPAQLPVDELLAHSNAIAIWHKK